MLLVDTLKAQNRRTIEILIEFHDFSRETQWEICKDKPSEINFSFIRCKLHDEFDAAVRTMSVKQTFLAYEVLAVVDALITFPIPINLVVIKKAGSNLDFTFQIVSGCMTIV